MNLKHLSLAVLVLALLAGGVAWLNRPVPPVATDPRVGQPLLATATANDANSVAITQNGNTVTLARDGSEVWRVTSYHDLPVDLTKLRRFVSDLTDAKIERVVTRDPERISHLEFGTASVTLKGAAGAAWTADLGKNAERGGRYVRFESTDQSPAYLTRFSGYLDSTAKNWADSKLVAIDAKDVAKVSLTFPDGTALAFHRDKADGAWTGDDLPAGQEPNVTRLTSLLTSFNNVRFTDTTAPDDTDAVDARAPGHTRTATLTTFAGDTLAITLGRRPEKTIVKPAPAATETTDASPPGAEKDDAKPAQDTTETIPAGPVFAQVSGPSTLAPLAEAGAKLAFKVSDYLLTSLPATPSDLLTAAAPPPAPTISLPQPDAAATTPAPDPAG